MSTTTVRTPAEYEAQLQKYYFERSEEGRAVRVGEKEFSEQTEIVKRYTTAGTAHDQGKTAGMIASAVIAEELGRQIAEMGTTTFRPPYTPVAFAALAGRAIAAKRGLVSRRSKRKVTGDSGSKVAVRSFRTTLIRRSTRLRSMVV